MTRFQSAGMTCLAALALANCAGNPSATTFPTAAEKAAVVAAPRNPALAAAGSAQDIWQLRSALNVAALGCRQSGGTDIGPRYNAMLKQHQTLLTQAYVSEELRYRKTFGARWQAAQDKEATQLYNRYANHPNLPKYCAEADEISKDALAVTEADFARFAAAALPRLEAPAYVPPPPKAVAKKPATKAPARKPAKKA